MLQSYKDKQKCFHKSVNPIPYHNAQADSTALVSFKNYTDLPSSLIVFECIVNNPATDRVRH